MARRWGVDPTQPLGVPGLLLRAEAVGSGWGVSSRGGSHWEPLEAIRSQQQHAFVRVKYEQEPLGAIGSHKQRVFV